MILRSSLDLPYSLPHDLWRRSFYGPLLILTKHGKGLALLIYCRDWDWGVCHQHVFVNFSKYTFGMVKNKNGCVQTYFPQCFGTIMELIYWYFNNLCVIYEYLCYFLFHADNGPLVALNIPLTSWNSSLVRVVKNSSFFWQLWHSGLHKLVNMTSLSDDSQF